MTWSLHNSPHNNGQCYIYQNQKSKSIQLSNITLLSLNLNNTIAISSTNNWQYAYNLPLIKQKTIQPHLIVIFTNQNDLNTDGHLTIEQFKTMIEIIDSDLNVSFQVFVSTGKYYNKPVTSMWKLFKESNNINDHNINWHKSIYVGSKAGRKRNSFYKSDIDSSDYYFSRNIHLKFKTPEQFFLNNKNSHHIMLPISFNPKYYINQFGHDFTPILQQYQNNTSNSQNIIIIMGSPACGKSRICSKYLTNHIRINQDTLKSVNNCIKKAKEKLDKGHSIIIDNTNRYIKVRNIWINMAKDYGIPVDCIHIDISRNMSLHFNSFRHYLGNGNSSIPDIAIYSYFSKKDKTRRDIPTMHEGYRNLITLCIDTNFDKPEIYDTLSKYIRNKYDASYILD